MALAGPVDVLIPEEAIRRRVGELAEAIRRDCPGDIHLVAVLRGAFVFVADLARALAGDLTVDFIAIESYASATTSSGEVRLVKDLETAIDGRDVLVVEDIVDTGHTLAYLRAILGARRPRTLRTVCLLSKASRRQVEVPVEYIGFAIDDSFVVGYGLDYAEHHRNLPYIGLLP